MVISLAFTCHSDNPSESLTDAELISALLARVEDLKKDQGIIQEGAIWVEETDEEDEG